MDVRGIVAEYREKHAEEYGWKPAVNYAKVGGLMAKLERQGFTAEDIRTVIRCAYHDKEIVNGNKFELPYILSASVFNNLMRCKREEPESKEWICPGCGKKWFNNASRCLLCGTKHDQADNGTAGADS